MIYEHAPAHAAGSLWVTIWHLPLVTLHLTIWHLPLVALYLYVFIDSFIAFNAFVKWWRLFLSFSELN